MTLSSSSFDERWEAFVRVDHPQWGYLELFKCLLLFPLALARLLLIIIICLITYFISFCCSPLPKYIIGPACRLVLFLLGFYWISQEEPLSQEPSQDLSNPAPLILCNHLSYVDMLVLLAKCGNGTGISFVSKEGIGQAPVIGRIAHAIGCIFVPDKVHRKVTTNPNNNPDSSNPDQQTEQKAEEAEHENKASPRHSSASEDVSYITATAAAETADTVSITMSNHPNNPDHPTPVSRTTQLIQNYIQKQLNSRKHISSRHSSCSSGIRPLVIFPEGTTSNGTKLLSFRSGAFIRAENKVVNDDDLKHNLARNDHDYMYGVQPYLIKYQYNSFNPAWETYLFIPHLLHLSCQFYNQVKLVKLQRYDPSGEEVP